MTLYEAAMYCYAWAARMLFTTSMAYWCLWIQLQTLKGEF